MKFRLQRVLDLRHSEEELAKKELAGQELAYRQSVRQLDLLQEDEEHLWGLIRTMQKEGTDLLHWQLTTDFYTVLKEKIENQEEKRRKHLEFLEKQRARVKSCWQKRRVLEILRSKAVAEHKKIMEGKEQNTLDEHVLFSFDRGVSKGF